MSAVPRLRRAWVCWFTLGIGVALLIAVLPPAATHALDTPTGVLRIAYPEEPVVWHPADRDDPPAVDLAHLWGVPLYRYDHNGQLRPALAASSRVEPGADGEPWRVEIVLREGRWSDGEPIVAADVVATLGALGETGVGPELAGLRSAEAVDDRRVRLEFEGPEPRWPHLLAGGRSVLPEHVLEDGGLDRYAGDVPVSGGPYRLIEHDPALRAVFERHDEGPLGAPGLDRLEVYFTPSYETALGLLDDHRVDVAMGYLAPNTVGRALRIEGVEAASPIGGTWTTLAFQAGDGLGAAEDDRRAARDAVSVAAIADGLLGRAAEPMTSTIPGVTGPWEVDRGVGAPLEGRSLTVVMRGSQEITGVTGRMIQHHFGQAGGQAELVRLELDEDVDRGGDVEYTVRRDGSRPALVTRLPTGVSDELREAVRRGDRAWRPDDEDADTAMGALHAAAWERPLFRAGVGHAWRGELRGVRASSWSGLGWWEVERWAWDEDGPPEQVATLRDDG